jgi:hypothetical protein
VTAPDAGSPFAALLDPAASGARSAGLGAHLAASLLCTAARVARRAHPGRSELYEQGARAETLQRTTNELLQRSRTRPEARTAFSSRPAIRAASEAEAALALDVAWAAADIAEAGQRLFATNILDVRPDAVTVCQLAHSAAASAAVIVADSVHRAAPDPRVVEVSGCLSRTRAAQDKVMAAYRYLEVELIP